MYVLLETALVCECDKCSIIGGIKIPNRSGQCIRSDLSEGTQYNLYEWRTVAKPIKFSSDRKN